MTKTHIRILRPISELERYIDGKRLRIGLIVEVTLFDKGLYDEFFLCPLADGSIARKYRHTVGKPHYEHVSPLALLALASDD